MSASSRPAATFAVAGLFVAAALVLTWPLALHIDTHVPGVAADDNVNFLWNLWWAREALFEPAELFFTDRLFHPYGTSLALHTHALVSGVIGATLLRPLSLVHAQNVLLIAAVALNGFTAFLLARRVTSTRLPAIVAGLYFASAPYFAAHLLGHFNLVHAWGLPLFAIVFLRALTEPAPAPARAAIAGVVFALLAYTDYYYVVYAIGFAMVALAIRWWTFDVSRAAHRPWAALDALLTALIVLAIAGSVWIAVTGGGVVDVAGQSVSMTSGLNLRTAAWVLGAVLAWRRRPRLRVARRPDVTVRADARGFAIAAAVALVLTLPLSIAAACLWLAGDYIAPARLWRSATGGVDLTSLVAGNPFHPWWRGTADGIYARFGMSSIEGVAWLGVAPMLILLWRYRHWRRDPRARLWLTTAIVFFVWALGPFLTVAGEHTGLILPETLLHYVPIVSNARIPGRAMVMVYLATGVLLAIALSSLRVRASAIAAALVLVDFIAAPMPLYRLEQPAIYDVLAKQRPGAVLELPLGVSDGFGERGALDNAVLYYQTRHGRPLVGGFVARLPRSLAAAHDDEPALRSLLALSAGEVPDTDVIAVRDAVTGFLKQHGIQFIVVNVRTVPSALHDLLRTLPIGLIADVDGRQLFTVGGR